MLTHARTTLREMDQMIRPYPTRAAIRSIACPVTVIEGDLNDPAFATAVAFVMRLLPQTRMVSLPGAAHMLHVDQPGELGRGRHSDDWPGAIARSHAKPAPANSGLTCVPRGPLKLPLGTMSEHRLGPRAYIRHGCRRAPTGPAHVTEVAKLLTINLTTSRHLTSLEQKGLLSRKGSDTDGRAAVVQLTDAGKHTVSELRKGHKDYLQSS
ncbi:MAG: hypothetical protein ACRDJ3_03555 [Solirubrobacteraceae bacterium]